MDTDIDRGIFSFIIPTKERPFHLLMKPQDQVKSLEEQIRTASDSIVGVLNIHGIPIATTTPMSSLIDSPFIIKVGESEYEVVTPRSITCTGFLVCFFFFFSCALLPLLILLFPLTRF